MSEACEIFAAVTADGLEVMGSSEVPHIYVCTLAGVYTPPAAPLVCAGAGASYAVGRWAQTPAGKALIEKASEKGCDVVIRFMGGSAEYLLMKGAEVEKDSRQFLQKANATYKSLNTVEGINWMMRYLSTL